MERINTIEAAAMQLHQWTEKLSLSLTIPANSETLGKLDIANLGMFRLKALTGRYTTLAKDGTNCKDTGVNYCRARIIDGATNRAIFNDYIPLENFLSPGRCKASKTTLTVGGTVTVLQNPNVATDPAAPQIFYPVPLHYDFAINSSIQISIKNSSDVDQTVDLMFHGIRVMQSMVQ